MSNLNQKNTSKKGVSYNGNVQELKNAEQQLYDITVMTLYGKDSFYESVDDRLVRLEQAVNAVVAKGNLDFIANTIIHARTAMNIRSLPIVLTVLFAKALREQNKSYGQLRHVVRDVIQRVDQITDLYAVALGVFGEKKAIPTAIKRGVADSFNKFNEYNFAKYNGDKGVKLSDVLRIVHPKGKSEEQGLLFKKIINDALEIPYTWETELSRNGQLPANEQKSKSQLWGELITSNKLGYMALLRNLRNIVEAGVNKETMQLVYDRLADPEQVAKSKQLPFRFFNALENVEHLGDAKLVRALSRAVDASLGNLPQIGNNVWIIIDCSGSMSSNSYQYRSHNSTGPVPIKVATMFGAALAKANAESDNVRITMFSDHAKHIPVNTDDSVLSITNTLIKNVYGGGTNLQAALDQANKLGFTPDTVIVLSDMQVNNLKTRNVGAMFGSDCIKVAINLEAYESTPCGVIDGWFQLAGWSDRLFDFIPALRNKQSIVKTLSVPYGTVDVVPEQDVA